MTKRELMSAASVLMLLAGTPVLALAEEVAPATTEAPTAEGEQAADEAATAVDAEQPADEAPVQE